MFDLTFTRTATAAQSDRLSKWELIAAIAEDRQLIEGEDVR